MIPASALVASLHDFIMRYCGGSNAVAFLPPVLVQQAAANAGGTATITVPLAATQAGNYLVAMIASEAGVASVVANPGGVALTREAHSLVNRTADIWMLPSAAAGFTSIVVTQTVAAGGTCNVEEWTNVSGIGVPNTSSGTGVITTGPVTPSSLLNVTLACASSRGAYVSGPTNGFTGLTQPTPDGNSHLFPAYLVGGALVPTTTGWTNDNGAFGWDTAAIVLNGLGSPPTNLQAAINATPVGGTLDITGGDYTGQFTITQSITLKGNGIIRLPAGSTATQALNIQANNVTIDGVRFDGTGNTNAAGSAIWTIGCSSLTVKNCNITNFVYAAVMVLGATSPVVTGNTIAHIGVGQPAGTNAYGIAFSHNGAGAGCTNITASNNNISDIPTWIGINAHAAVGGTVSGNVCDGVRRAYFFAIDTTYTISGLTFTGNHAKNAGGLTDPTAYLIESTQNLTFTNNFMDATYPWPADGIHGADKWTDGVDDFNNLSTGLVATGMTLGA